MGQKGVLEVDNMVYVPAQVVVVDTSPWKVAAAILLVLLWLGAAAAIVHAAAIVPAAAFVPKGQVPMEHLQPKYKNRFWI